MDAATSTTIVSTPIRDWIVRHDDSRAFVLLYLVLALVLSIAVGLFWLLALVGVHLGFEYVCARHRGAAPRRAAGEAAWALRLDLALVLFALALSLYLKYVFGLLGLQAAGRAASTAQAGVRGGARFAAWERVVHGFLITMDDMARGVRAVAVRRGRLSRGDVLTLGFGGLCLVLILAAPWLGYGSWTESFAALAAELRPFPSRGG